jgi:dehydrogluconokinase
MTALAFDVATLGEMMVLFVAEQPGPLEQVGSFRKCTAGAETNVAIGLSRLGLRSAATCSPKCRGRASTAAASRSSLGSAPDFSSRSA